VYRTGLGSKTPGENMFAEQNPFSLFPSLSIRLFRARASRSRRRRWRRRNLSCSSPLATTRFDTDGRPRPRAFIADRVGHDYRAAQHRRATRG
jgi:hypothetical protein